MGSWLLVLILLSLVPSAYISNFQLNLYLKKPRQILKSDLFFFPQFISVVALQEVRHISHPYGNTGMVPAEEYKQL